MESILLTHAARYPQMEPRDAVKLIYQNEFGGGHLIKDEAGCLHYLRREYAAVRQDAAAPLLEDLGNGILRVNLAALDARGLSVSDLGQAFLRSAATHTGSLDLFLEKLQILKDLTSAKRMPFSPEALDTYLKEYEQAGFPPVSHSETYRTLYHPAYRVVRKDIMMEYLPEQMQ